VIGAKTAYSDRYLPPFHVHGGHNH
jgi:hypothetical protein